MSGLVEIQVLFANCSIQTRSWDQMPPPAYEANDCSLTDADVKFVIRSSVSVKAVLSLG